MVSGSESRIVAAGPRTDAGHFLIENYAERTLWHHRSHCGSILISAPDAREAQRGVRYSRAKQTILVALTALATGWTEHILAEQDAGRETHDGCEGKYPETRSVRQ
jgi:hypothetical protein